MDKYEYKIKNEEIKSLIKQREFQKAMQIADTIDWTRIRSVTTLCTISDLYKINRRYKDAKILLEQAYDRYPNGRMIVYSLCELCIKMEEIVQAIEYYKQFVLMAPTDSNKFILQYKIYEAQEVSLEERIAVLEELKKRDYREKWGYELAYLYHRIGLATKCVEECNEVILWFREGTYVKKAMELKMLHQQLDESQMDIYKGMLSPKEKEEFVKQNTTEIPSEDPEDDIRVKTMDMSKYNTINLQRELAESMKDVLVADSGFAPLTSADDEDAKPGTYIPDDFSPEKIAADVVRASEHPGTTTENISRTIISEATGSVTIPENAGTGTLTAKVHDTGEMEEIIFDDDEEVPQEDSLPVHEEPESQSVVPQAPFDPVKDLELTVMYGPDQIASKLGEITPQEAEDIDEEALEEAQIPKVGTNTAELIGLDDTVEIVDPIEATKVFNREEIHAVAKAYNSSLKADSYGFEFDDPTIKQPHEDLSDHITEDIGDKQKEELLELIDKRVQEAIAKAFDVNREAFAAYAPVQPVVVEPAPVQAPQVAPRYEDRIPRGMEDILGQDSDGQISMFVPDAPIVEKQITGQLSIEDILLEWENRTKIQQQKAEQAVAKEIIEETGSLFTDTEALRIDGILEKLQRDEVPEDVDTEAEYEKYLKELMEEEAAQAAEEQQNDDSSEADEEQDADKAQIEEAIDVADEENVSETSEATNVADEENISETSKEAAETEDGTVEVEDTDTEADDIQDNEEALTPEVEAAQAQAIAAREAAELAAAQAAEAKRIAQEAAAAALLAQEEAQAAREAEEALESDDDGVEELAEIEEAEISDTEEADEKADEIVKPAVESEEAVDARSMSEDELALFAQFAQTKRARQNLLHALDKISLAAYTGNVFVTGETADESLELAKNVIRYVKNTDGNFTGKIAKVSGDALNNKMISVMVEKLANGGLIIEKASTMSAETTKDLLKALNQEKTGIVVALQDTKKNMYKMMEHFVGMKQIFNIHIEVEELSDDALVAYGKKYAEHLEYSIDDMGILALHQRIDELQTSDHVVTVSDVRDIIDEAIEKANKKSLRHFKDILFAKRYDEEDMIILRENDFLNKD